MVAFSSRLAVLVAFAWFASVSGAPVQDTTSDHLSYRATHSDHAQRHSKPPVIPAPKGHKATKGHNHKQLKDVHKRSAAGMFASNPFAKMAAFAMNGPARRQGGGIFKRQQALLSTSAARSQLGRRDHDHDHDDDDDDDDHHHHHHHHHHHGRDAIQTLAGASHGVDVRRRAESNEGAVGVVAIQSPSTDSRNKVIGYMVVKESDGRLLIDASEWNKTELELVPVKDAVQNQSDKVVLLQLPVYNSDYMMTQQYCATYDRAPPVQGSEMEMRPCGEENQTRSQMFSVDRKTNIIQPSKFGAGNDALSAAQVGEDEESLIRRQGFPYVNGVQMVFVPKDLEVKEVSSTSTVYTSTVTATETFTSTATVTVSTSPTSMSAAATSSSPSITTNPSSSATTVEGLASSTMPAALDIKLATPSSISDSASSSELTETSTTMPGTATSSVSATSTSVDAAAVASSIAGESSS